MTFQVFPKIQIAYAQDDSLLGVAASSFRCTIALPAPKVFAIICGIAIAAVLALAFVIAGLVGMGVIGATSLPMVFFWVDLEGNVPAFLNYALLIFAFFLLALTSLSEWKEDSPWRLHWTILSIIFLYLAFDEAARMHERLGQFGGQIITPEGIFRFAWVVIALPIVAIFALAYLRFLIALPRRPALLMFLSGCIYVSGAIGVEMVNSALWSAAGGHRTMGYVFFTLMEEGMEMVGVTIFCVSLLTYLSIRRSIAQT